MICVLGMGPPNRALLEFNGDFSDESSGTVQKPVNMVTRLSVTTPKRDGSKCILDFHHKDFFRNRDGCYRSLMAEAAAGWSCKFKVWHNYGKRLAESASGFPHLNIDLGL